MAAQPLNTATYFVFYSRFCNSLDFNCTLHPKKNCFYHFQGLYVINKESFSKFKDNSRTYCTFLEFKEFSRTKVIFKDFSRSVRTLGDEWLSKKIFHAKNLWCPSFSELLITLTLMRQTKTAADNILILYFYLLNKTTLGFSCESSA